MAQPVWVLSVDLQTKTATFQTGMAEAARSARGTFREISQGSHGMAKDMEHGSIDVRHSIGLVDNFIRGAHAQAIADLIRMYGKSALVMGALPLAATAAGIGLIGGIAFEAAEHIRKMKEEAEKLSNSLTKQNTSGNSAFRQLDDEILKAEQHADELRNNHLGALKAELELIDDQSMAELVKSFGLVQKAADTVFKELEGHWYSIGIGSEGASHALDQFQVKYENLLNQGKNNEASDLLHGTLDSAKKVLALQKDLAANPGGLFFKHTDLTKGYQDAIALKQYGVGYSQKEVEAQQALVTALEQQAGIESRVNELKNQGGSNAKVSAAQEASRRSAAVAKESAASQLSIQQSTLAGEKATADAQLAIHHSSIEERLQSDLAFASRERDMREKANQTESAALDKSGRDFQEQLRAHNDKVFVIEQQYETKVATMKARAAVEENQRDTQALEQAVREQISGERQGSAARITAIDAGIREAQARQLQDTNFYRELMTERVQAVRQEADEEAKRRADGAREEADNTEKMGALTLAAEKQQMALEDSARHVTNQQRIEAAEKLAEDEYAIEMKALEQKIQGLDKSGRDYEVKLKQLQDREKQLTQQHGNEMAAIQDKAAIQSNQNVISAYKRMVDETSRSLTQSIMGHERWSRMLLTLGDQVVSGAIQNAIKSAMMDDFDKERDAAKAARKFFLAGAQLPFPANLIAAPVMAAGAFATVMAFAGGGIVPGVGRGDVVPAMLTPGEAILPKSMTDHLMNAARSGGTGGGNHYTVHVHNRVNASALDGDGMQAVLDKHADQLQKHFENTLRKMNR